MATVSYDYITSLRLVLSEADIDISVDDLADIMVHAAELMLQSAIQGRPVTDHLTKEQIGVIMAALMWNYNPMVQQAVRLKQ
jgi:hypothetical protein